MSETQEQETLPDNVEAETQTPSPTELPGRRLRETREEKQLSREEVASHLRLDVQLIIALEEDQYADLPSPAYICGYLRSYARLLKLPEKEIVEAYNHGEEINSALIPSSVKIKPHKQLNPGLVKFIFILVVLALIGAGAYYLIDKYKIFSSKASDTGKVASQSSALPVPGANGTVTETINTNPPADSAKTHTATPDKSSHQVKKSPPPVPPAERKTGVSKVEKLPSPKSTIPASEPVSSAKHTAEKSSPANTANKTASSKATSNAGQGNSSVAMSELRMTFTEDCWVEVTDSANNRLIYRLVDKGANITLEGIPPFTILLGNAPGAQVFYKGKEFDHKGYHHDQVAYFQVGNK